MLIYVRDTCQIKLEIKMHEKWSPFLNFKHFTKFHRSMLLLFDLNTIKRRRSKQPCLRRKKGRFSILLLDIDRKFLNYFNEES